MGSLASLQDQGSLVVSAFAQQLNLTVPTSTWHGERDRIEIASVLGIIVGNTGKMARDWSLMMQTEIAELFEPTARVVVVHQPCLISVIQLRQHPY